MPGFLGFELQPEHRRLMRDGEPVPLGARAFDVLLALVERHDRLVTKSELMDVVWAGLVVEENNLQVQISTLRKALGPKAIATIPGRGYRFVAPLAARDALPANGGQASDSIASSPRPASGAPSTNVQPALSPLYGRAPDLDELGALVASRRLVTVVGPGGIGKSRLAQAVAHSFAGRCRDGAWMVQLAGLTDPQLLSDVVAQVLSVPIFDQSLKVDELLSGLASRELLLVLDNCEHLLDAVATHVQAILERAPGVTVLATSQEPLHLAAEQQYRVRPLAVPPDQRVDDPRAFGAIALFEARVRAVDRQFDLARQDVAAVIDICRSLDGLPLAIELAAARVATLGALAVRDKLDARFRLLTGGPRATLGRHQTLRATLEWSHNLLNGGEQVVFRRLGVFAGGFSTELAQAVCADAQLDEWAVLDHLGALVDKSLVVADPGDAPRYRLLESARAFALDLLAATELAALRERHALALLDLLRRADLAYLDGELRSARFAALIVPDLDNLRAAHKWARSTAGNRQFESALAAHAGALVDYASECVDWLLPLQPHVEGGAVERAVAARYWRAVAATNMVGHVPRALQVDATCRALALYRAAEEPRAVFWCLMQLARHRIELRDDAGATAAADEARQVLRPDWPIEFRVLMSRLDGHLAGLDGRLAEALDIRREAARISAASGDWRLEVIDRLNLVDALWEFGQTSAAADEAGRLVESLRTCPAVDADMAMLYANFIGILSETGRIEEASAAALEALPIMRRSRYVYVEALPHLLWRRGQLDAAACLLGAANAERARLGTPRQENERRLLDETSAALAAALPAATLASHLAAGAALPQSELVAFISQALARRPVVE